MATSYNSHLPQPGAYTRAWAALNKMHHDTLVSVPGWVNGSGFTRTMRAREVLTILVAALQNRINARAGIEVRESRETDIALHRDAQRVRDILQRRVRVYQFETRGARRRFAHLLARHDD